MSPTNDIREDPMHKAHKRERERENVHVQALSLARSLCIERYCIAQHQICSHYSHFHASKISRLAYGTTSILLSLLLLLLVLGGQDALPHTRDSTHDSSTVTFFSFSVAFAFRNVRLHCVPLCQTTTTTSDTQCVYFSHPQERH